jgi:hypothetical protein
MTRQLENRFKRSPRTRFLPAEWVRNSLWALPFVIGLMLVTERPAHAYADPGSGALIWQIVAAGFVGLMFYVRKFTSWFKAKKKETED